MQNHSIRHLIGFLKVSLGNCQKEMDMKRHFPNHIKYFIALFLSHKIYFVKQIKKKKKKDLTDEESNASTHYF